MKICEYCKRMYDKQNKRYCSRDCYYKSDDRFEERSKAGKIGGRISAVINKENKTSFYDTKIQSMGGKIGGKSTVKINRKLKRGIFFDEKLRHIITAEERKRGNETNRKNKTGSFFDKKIHTKNGFLSQHILRTQIRNLFLNGQYYDSKPEIEISLCLINQYNYNPKENKTLHIRIGNCEYDYLLTKLKLFIEFHQWFVNTTEEEYYTKRRKNLNKNSYGNYQLIVIK